MWPRRGRGQPKENAGIFGDNADYYSPSLSLSLSLLRTSEQPSKTSEISGDFAFGVILRTWSEHSEQALGPDAAKPRAVAPSSIPELPSCFHGVSG